MNQTAAPIARWMGARSRVNFRAPGASEIRLDIATHMPDLGVHPLGIELLVNGVKLCAFSLCATVGWKLRVLMPAALASETSVGFEMEIRADRTWQPRPTRMKPATTVNCRLRYAMLKSVGSKK